MASETLNGFTVTVTIRGTVAGSNGTRQTIDETYEKSFTDGTGANQAGAVWWADGRSLASTNETLDIDALTDFKGATMTDAVGMKLAYFRNNSTTSGDELTVFGGDFATPMGDATDKIKIGPGGILLLISPIDGYVVTASTGDGLLVATDYTGTYDGLLVLDNT